MKLKHIVVIILILIFGIVLGFSIHNFPLVKWNKEIKIYEVFQVVSTLFIGIALPFFIKKWIDDDKSVKSLISDEGKSIILETKKIKERFLFCFQKPNQEITELDKQYINHLFTQVEELIEHFKTELDLCFEKHKDKNEIEYRKLQNDYLIFWKSITNEKLMNKKFILVELEDLTSATAAQNKFEISLKKFLISIQRF